MADKLTLLELHLHAEDNEFSSDMELGSDLGGIVRDRFGLGEDTEDEQSSFDETDFSTESSTSAASADGGNTVQVGDTDDEEKGAVVEIDETTTDDEDEASGGRSKTKALFTLVLLVGLAMLARRYLDGGDEFEDEFEEL